MHLERSPYAASEYERYAQKMIDAETDSMGATKLYRAAYRTEAKKLRRRNH